MVHDHVKDNFHAALMNFVNELQGVIHRAVFGSDVSVAADVVASISLRRGKERRDPDRFESQLMDVIQLLDNAF